MPRRRAWHAPGAWRTDRPCRGLEQSDEALPRRRPRPPARPGRRRPGAGRRPGHHVRAPRDRDAEGHRGRRRRAARSRSSPATACSPAAAPRASSSSSACARRARSTASSAPAARSSPRSRARRWTACARWRRSATGGSSPPARCGWPTARRAWWPSGCCPRARSTRASARASATCWPARRARELGAMTMDRNGNVILGGVRPGEIPIVIRLLADGSADPTFGAGGTLDGAALGIDRPRHRAAGARRRHADLHVGGGPRGIYPATFTTVRVGPTGALDPTFGGTGIVSLPLGTGQAAGARRRGDPPGPVRHDARRRHRPDGRRHAARRGHPPAGRTARSTRASAAAASRGSPARAARSGSRRWPATAPAGSCSPAPASRRKGS